MDYSKIAKGAEKLHEKASNTGRMKVKTDSGIFFLQYNPYYSNFETFNESGANVGPNWNTRKITVARQWLKDWYNN